MHRSGPWVWPTASIFRLAQARTKPTMGATSTFVRILLTIGMNRRIVK